MNVTVDVCRVCIVLCCVVLCCVVLLHVCGWYSVALICRVFLCVRYPFPHQKLP